MALRVYRQHEHLIVFDEVASKVIFSPQAVDVLIEPDGEDPTVFRFFMINNYLNGGERTEFMFSNITDLKDNESPPVTYTEAGFIEFYTANTGTATNKEKRSTYTQLAQLVPASPNTPELLYSPDVNQEVHILTWAVVNTQNNDVNFNIFDDADGTTYDDTTLVFRGTVDKLATSPAGETTIFVNDSNGSIGFEADDVDCVVTIWGVIYDIS